MATLTVVNNLEGAFSGITYTAKQGEPADDFGEGYDLTVSGYVHEAKGALATATVRTLFDDDVAGALTDWDYLWFWADGTCYLQLVSAATNVVHKITAYVPFVIAGDSLLAAADTTLITGGAEPAVADIDSIALGNYSGASINYRLLLID